MNPLLPNNDPDISIVVPLYNEEGSLKPLYASLKKACDKLDLKHEKIFVDDGSTDSTYSLLMEFRQNDPTVRTIKFRKNYGQTAAMAAGFELARGKIIVSMDGDLQNDPSDIPRLLAKLEEGYDVVCGWRKKRRDTFLTRRIPSMAANWIIGHVTGVRIHDNGCSLKAYRAPVIKNVSLYGEMHRFIPAMSKLTGARIAEIVVTHHPRRFGKSKYGISRIWRVILDIITVKMITSFSSRPALWFGLISLPVLGLGVSTFALASGMFFQDFREAWMVLSTISFLFLALGAHLIAMGIIAELSMKTGDYSPQKTIRPTIWIS